MSICPDAYLNDLVTGDIKGAIKLHFPKTTPLNEQVAEYVDAAMKVFLHKKKRSPIVDHRKC